MPVNEEKNEWSMHVLPVMGFAQAVHLLEKSSPKQSAQYGLSSLNINRNEPKLRGKLRSFMTQNMIDSQYIFTWR